MVVSNRLTSAGAPTSKWSASHLHQAQGDWNRNDWHAAQAEPRRLASRWQASHLRTTGKQLGKRSVRVRFE